MNPLNNSNSIARKAAVQAAATASSSQAVDLREKAELEAAQLLEREPAFKHDKDMIRAFCSLHCTASVRNTNFEGGNPKVAFQYLHNLQKIQNFPISPGLSPQQLTALSEPIEELVALDELINPITKNTHPATPEKLKETIAALCQKHPNKSCYLPFILKHTDSGHYITIKVRLMLDGRYAISYINKGYGSQFHDPLAAGIYKSKNDYQSQEFAVKLDSQKGTELLEYLILMQTDDRITKSSNVKIVKQYSDVELYALLAIFGQALQGEKRTGPGHATTSQRTGICWIANTRAAIDDFLLEKGLSAAGKKRYEYALKLASLIEAYKAYKKEITGHTYDYNDISSFEMVLREALQELNVRNQKLYPEVLTSEEVALAKALSKKIAAHIDELQQRVTDWSKYNGKEMPELTGDLPIGSRQPAQAEKKSPENPEKKLSYEFSINPTISPYDLAPYLERASTYFGWYGMKTPEQYLLLRQLMLALPPTSGKESDPFWDKIPKEDVPKVLHSLHKLVYLTQDANFGISGKDDQYYNQHKVKNRIAQNGCRIHNCEIGLIAFDIAAQLASRVDELKMNGEYAFELSDVYLDQDLFHDVESYQIVKRIIGNFKRRSAGKKAVFGAIINNNQDDPTRKYVLKNLLTEEGKQLWCLQKRGQRFPQDYSEEEMFSDMFSDKKAFDKPYLTDQLHYLIELSHFAHTLGSEMDSVIRYNNGTLASYYDVRSAYFTISDGLNVGRALYSKKTIDSKSLRPDSVWQRNSGFYENATFHPYDVLLRQREQLNPKFDLCLAPLGTSRYDHYCDQKEKDPKGVLEEWVDEDLRVIEASPHLQVQKIMEWAQHHVDQLAQPLVQNRIFSLLFEYGKIEEAYRDDPEDFVALATLFQKAIWDYSTQSSTSLEMTLWAARLTHYLKAYFAEYQIPDTLINTRSHLLLRLEKAKIQTERMALAECLVHSYQGQTQLSKQDYLDLISYLGLTKMRYHSKGELYTIADYTNLKLLTKHQEGIKKALSSLRPRDLNDFAKHYIKLSAGIEVNRSWKRKSATALEDEAGKYRIDIETGQILKSGNALVDFTSELKNDSIFKRLHLTEVLKAATLEENKLVSADGKWEIFLQFGNEISITGITRKMLIDGEEFAGTYTDYFGTRAHPNIPIKEGQEYNYIVFELHHQNNSDRNYYIEPCMGGECYYRNPAGRWQVIKEEKPHQWVSQDTQIMNLHGAKTDWERSWCYYLQRFDAPKEIVVKTIGKDIQSIEFKRFDLLFEPKLVNGEWRLYARDPQGYYWQPGATIPELNGIQSVFILKNDEGDTKVLLPAFEFKRMNKSSAFQKVPQFDLQNDPDIILTKKHIKEKPYVAYQEGKPYFAYHYDKQKQLVGQTIAADLYISLIYRGLRDFKRAMDALNRTHHHANNTPLMWKIASQVVHQNELSLSGAAFDSHFANRMTRHRNKWSNPKDNEDNLIKEFEGHVEKQENFLKRNLSDYKSQVYNLPEYLRLEEKTPDADMKPSKNVSPGAQRILSPRLMEVNLYNFERYSKFSDQFWSRGTPCPQEKTFSRIYPVNPSSETPGLDYMKSNYISLFEKACSKSDDTLTHFQAEMLFLIHNDLEWTSSHAKLAASLLFVYNRPEAFRDYIGAFHDPKNCFEEVLAAILKHPSRAYEKSLFVTDVSNYGYVKDVMPIESRLLEGRRAAFQLDPLSPEAIGKVPLQQIFGKYFTSKPRPITQGDFSLTEKPNATKLENRLTSRYRSGHEKNQKNSKEIYRFEPNKTTAQLKTELEQQKEKDLGTAETLLGQVLTLAQTMPKATTGQSAEELQRVLTLIAAQKAKQKRPIALGDLLMSLLKQKPALLTEKNCFLDQPQLQAIYAKLVEYCLIQSRISQIAEAVDLLADAKREGKTDLDPYFEQRLGMVLGKERTYNIDKHPEFLIYEYATGRMLQPEQVKILIWIVNRIETASPAEMRHLLIQFAAGGGKTAVIIPILAHRFAAEGYLPIIINTNDLYDTAIQDIPESLKTSFGQQIEVLEVELNHEWTVDQFETLLKNLEQWRKEEKVLLVKEVTWAAIHTAKKIAYANGDVQMGRAAQAALDFIKTHGLKLEDECHQISDPLKQSIRSFGQEAKITQMHKNLLLRFYDMLMGRDPGTEEMAELAGISAGSKKEVNVEDLPKIQRTLAEKICSEEMFDPMQDKKALLSYLMQPSKKRPEWLKQLRKDNPEVANHVVAARAFIKTHLPHILTLQYEKNYGTSVHPGDLTAAPKNNGRNTTAHFSDPQLIAALSIQLVEQQAVPEAEMRKILSTLKTKHQQEKKWHKSPTPSDAILAQLSPAGMDPFSFETMTEEEMAYLCRDKGVRKHPWITRKYLRDSVLEQVSIRTKRVSSTPPAQYDGFKRGIALTATPGLLEIYPVAMQEQNAHFETAFESEVIETLLKLKNSTSCLMKEAVESPFGFFAEFGKRFPEEFKKLDALIDRGALFCDFNSQTVVQAYLKFVKRFKKDQTAMHFEESHLHLNSNDPKVGALRLAGSQLVKELKKQGFKYEDLALFLFLSLNRTTGTDLKQKPTACAGLTVGKKQTVTDTIQAAMRERQLLWDDAQTIIWIMLESLHKEVSPTSTAFDPNALFQWMIANEAQELKVKIINRAYQGINHEVEKYIWGLIDTNRASYQSYKEQLEEKVLTEPYDLYEIESEEIETTDALSRYSNHLKNRFDLDESQLPKECRDNIAQIIRQTKDLVDKIPSPHGAELNALVFQENQQVAQNQEQQDQQQQQRQQLIQLNQLFTGQGAYKFTREKYGEGDRLSDRPIADLASKDSHYDSFKFHFDAPSPQLIIHKEYLSPLVDHDSQKFTKPISNMLVQILPDHTYRFMGCTAEGAEFYRTEFQRLKGKLGDVKFALIGFDHHILLSTDNLTRQEAQLLTQSPEVAEMTAFAAFLNGEINDLQALVRLIKKLGWNQETYKTVVEEIRHRHVSRHIIQLLSNPILEIECGWRRPENVAKALPRKLQSIELSAEEADTSMTKHLQPNDIKVLPRSTQRPRNPAANRADRDTPLKLMHPGELPKPDIRPGVRKIPPAAPNAAASKPIRQPFFLFRFFNWIASLLLRLFRKKS